MNCFVFSLSRVKREWIESRQDCTGQVRRLRIGKEYSAVTPLFSQMLSVFG